MAEISIRAARRDNARISAIQAVHLGYVGDESTMANRLDVALQIPDHAVFSGARDSATLGWVHVMHTLDLKTGHGTEISGLVVAEHRRGQDSGTRLAQETRRLGGRAHVFYLGLGYHTDKVQHVFVCALR